MDSFFTFTNYRYLWFVSISVLALTALAPIGIATLIYYQLIETSVDSDLNHRTKQLTAAAKSAVTFFMEERLNALTFTVNENGYEQLADNTRLAEILKNLKLGFGGVTDLSVLDAGGNQVAYAGPFNLEGKNYKNQTWFEQSLQKMNYISEVFTGYRGVPHIIITVRSAKPDGSLFILRATLDTERLMQTLSSYKTGDYADIFLVNHEGILQTPSMHYGAIFTRTGLSFAAGSGETEVKELFIDKKPVVSGYSFISRDTTATPFILMVMKEKAGMLKFWQDMTFKFNWIMGASVVTILIVINFASTFMVNRLYRADKAKAETMMQMEQSQQLASIGQLAAGVAHEINNPLAVINQTAGYIKDLFSFQDQVRNDEEIIEYIDSILDAVDRCGTITRQLLGFVRQFDVKIKKVNLQKLISQVLSFHKKEAEYRRIHVTVSIPDPFPELETDSSKLQQVLVNLINNAFQAVEEGSCLDILAAERDAHTVELVIHDTGCGIPEET
nr:two-component sensor histidine kinase [Desulfobacula sp.]